MFVGFDTSNYTTSLAVFDGENVRQVKKMLSVKSGQKGLRQSEALFQHTVNLPWLLSDFDINASDVDAVGVSSVPRNESGSYMPCFLAGVSAASAFAKGAGKKLYKTSHQTGHILSALYGAGRLNLVNEKHIAFHLSGGTTDALLVTPDEHDVIGIKNVAKSLDLKAGQAIDRTGVAMGLDFPCGGELDALSKKSKKEFSVKPSMKGLDCSFSGVENKMLDMIKNNANSEDIAKFVLTYVSQTVVKMLDGLFETYGKMPVVFSGGVSSNSLLRKFVTDKYGDYACFAPAEFSLDNAAGCAIYAKLKFSREH